MKRVAASQHSLWALWVCAAAAGAIACSTSSPIAAAPDATVADLTAPADLALPPDLAPPPDLTSPPPLRSCAEIKSADATARSGIYTIDPDAAGPLSAMQVYCEMSSEGGGWTLIFSFSAYDKSADWAYSAAHWTTAGSTATLGDLGNLGNDKSYQSQAHGQLPSVRQIMISTIPRATTSAQDLSATLGYVVYDSTKTLLSWLNNDGVTKVYAGTDKSHDYRYGMLVGAVCKNHAVLAPNLSATCSSVDPRTGPTLTFNWYDHDPLCAGYSRIAFGISDDLDYAASRHLGGSSGLVSVGGGYNVSMPSCAYNGASLYDTVQYLLWER